MCCGWDTPADAFLEGLNAAGSDFSRVADMSVDIWWMGFICRWISGGYVVDGLSLRVGFLAGGGYRRSGCEVDGIPLRMHCSKD